MVSTRAKREVSQTCVPGDGARPTRAVSATATTHQSAHDGRKRRKQMPQDGDAGEPLKSGAKHGKAPLPAAEGAKPGKSAVLKRAVESLSNAKAFAEVKSEKQAMQSLSDAKAIAKGIEYLKKCDAKLKSVIEGAEGLPEFEICDSPFLSLARGIVYQQLAASAAAAIHGRLVDLCGGEGSFTPAVVLQLPESDLRSIGLSARKAEYIQDLARKFIEGGLSDTSIVLMEDEELVSTLTAVKGIGMWSVHMFMIFALHRPDVLPITDLGIRKGFMKLYGLKSLPDPVEMEKLSQTWRPYRTLGAWYLWHVKETDVASKKALQKKKAKKSLKDTLKKP